MKPFTHTYPARTYDNEGTHTGPGPWLKVIHKANDLLFHALEAIDIEVPEDPGGNLMFGAPTWPDQATERYPDADVHHDQVELLDEPTDEWPGGWRDDNPDRPDTVTITSRTPLGALVLATAHRTVMDE